MRLALGKEARKHRLIPIPTLLFTTIALFASLSVLVFNLSIFTKEATSESKQTSPKSSTSSTSTHPPLIVFRKKDGSVRACIIPGACECAAAGEGCPPGSHGPLYFPERYHVFAPIISECTRNLKLHFYSGETPKLSPKPVRYDFDVVGRSMTSYRYKHFPHLVHHFTGSVVVPASLFLNRLDPSLPRPQCLRPDGVETSPCMTNELENLDPRLLVSGVVLQRPTKWNYEFFKLITSNSIRNGANSSKILHVVHKRFHHQCYRSLISSPEVYDVATPGHDSLFSKVGLKRTPRCRTHVVILTRDRKASMNRSVPPGFVAKVTEKVQALTHATVESVVGLGYLSFKEQVAVIQRADILVSVHGAELGNALFLRRNTGVIEIQPFGYYAPGVHVTPFGNYSENCFVNIMRSVRARYTPVWSPPDIVRFMQCSRKYKSRDSKLIGRKHFMKHRDMFEKAKTDSERMQAAEFQITQNGAAACARTQVIKINPDKLANIIVSQIQSNCPRAFT